jgi:(p)ppGpp synthase/HD superfamily hydrolase
MNVSDPQTNRLDQAQYVRAVAYALAAHGTQTRKESEVPYVAHVIQVSGLVLEHGGGIDQAIAALLHDVVEDCDGYEIEDIERHFGAVVAEIVADCTDREPGETISWRDRKERYIRHLAANVKARRPSVLVSFCDKRHNLGALVGDVGAYGNDYLERFNSDPAGQVWYYTQILGAAGGAVSRRLREEFEALLDEFRRQVGVDAPD